MKKVILMVNTSRGSGRNFLRGIEKYISINQNWEVLVQNPDYLPDNQPNKQSWFEISQADGIIVRDSPNTQEILKFRIPMIVNDTKLEIIPQISTIYTNSKEIGKIASDYFINLGFKNFAYCGFDNLIWSQKRFQSFKNNLESKSFNKIFNFSGFNHKEAISERLAIASWIKTLPKPVSVFACNDDRGIQILEACKISNIKVPEEVAVLGVDNDQLMCDLSSPPLSSINLEFEKVGFEAAKLLDEKIAGNKNNSNIVVEPQGIHIRQSTDIIAVEDKEVANALVFIRNNYRKQLQVQDVVLSTNLSRRTLELRFKAALKKSITQEINRLRIEYAKKRICNSSEPIYKIANELKFTDVEHFARFFKKMTSITPKQFRGL